MADVAVAILRVVAEIRDLAEGIHENDRQACRLLERVTAVEPVVLAVKQGKKQLSSESLRQLLETVENIRTFLDGYARTTKMNRALKRKANAASFTDFGAVLTEGMQALQLDVAVKAWAEEDASDRLEDLENMIDAMDKMELKHTDNHAEVMGALKALQKDERSELTTWVEIEYDKDLDFEGSIRLGSGGFGEVRTAKWNESEVAVKHLLAGGLHRDDIRALRKEIRIHSCLNFDHVVQLYAASTTAPHLCLVVELASRGSLRQYLHSTRKPLAHALQTAFLYDIARGMSFLHNKGILHRDLKSANVLVFAHGRLKLCDFGLSKINVESSSRSRAGGVGSTQWMSPEEMDGRDATKLTDVYSFGVVCFEVTTRMEPFKGKRPGQVVGAVLYREERPKIPEKTSASPDVVPLMERCWKQDSAQRPGGFVPVVQTLASVVKRVGDPRNQISAAEDVTSSSGVKRSGGAPSTGSSGFGDDGGDGTDGSSRRRGGGGSRGAASPSSSLGSFEGNPMGGSNSGSSAKQPGSSLSRPLMQMRSRLMKRWNSTLVGTPLTLGEWSAGSASGSGSMSPAGDGAAEPQQQQQQQQQGNDSSVVDITQPLVVQQQQQGNDSSVVDITQPLVVSIGGASGLGGGGGGSSTSTVDAPPSPASVGGGPRSSPGVQPGGSMGGLSSHTRDPPEPSAAPPPLAGQPAAADASVYAAYGSRPSRPRLPSDASSDFLDTPRPDTPDPRGDGWALAETAALEAAAAVGPAAEVAGGGAGAGGEGVASVEARVSSGGRAPGDTGPSAERVLLASSGSWSEAPGHQALTKMFRVALMFYTKELMANTELYGEGDKLALYGLFKQSKWGDCPAGLVSEQRDNPVGAVKVRAWVTNRGKPMVQAMKEFIAVLGRVSPGWESRVMRPASSDGDAAAAVATITARPASEWADALRAPRVPRVGSSVVSSRDELSRLTAQRTNGRY